MLAAQVEPVPCAVPDPIGTDSATPVSDEDDVPSDRELLASGLETLVRAYIACQTSGDFATMSRMVSESYLGQVYGGGPRMARSTFLEFASGLPTPPVRFRSFDDMSIIDEDEIRANVKLVVGNQLTFERLYFIEEERRPGVWLINATEPLRVQPPREHTTLDVMIAGDQYSPAQLTATGPTIEINLTNNDIEDHEFLVLKFPEGIGTGSLLIAPGPGLPEGVEYVAQVTIPGTESTNLVLVGIKPGTYAVVDLLPTQSGVPHLALGMQATLTITE